LRERQQTDRVALVTRHGFRAVGELARDEKTRQLVSNYDLSSLPSLSLPLYCMFLPDVSKTND
jgi:hypothetical protein